MSKCIIAINRSLKRVKGCALSKKTQKPYRYDFVAFEVYEVVEGADGKSHKEFHDCSIEPTRWDTIAQVACAETKVILEGNLVENLDKNGNLIQREASDGTEYIKRKLVEFEITNTENSPFAARALQLGARLPKADDLPLETYEDPDALAALEAGVEPEKSAAPAE